MRLLIIQLLLSVSLFAQNSCPSPTPVLGEQVLTGEQRMKIQLAQKDQQIAEQLVTINQYEQALAKATGDIANLRAILMKQNKDAADKTVQDAIAKAKDQVVKDKKWADAEFDDKTWTVKEKKTK